MLPKGYKIIVDWFKEVAADPNYSNPEFVRYDDGASEAEEEQEPGIKLDWDSRKARYFGTTESDNAD